MILLLACAWVPDLDARLDYDGDGFTSSSFGGEDCDDQDPDIHPRAEEICGNALDEDCDGLAEVERSWFRDADGDGWGGSEVVSCEPPDESYLERGGDCDDGDPSLHPETAWYEDGDGDGYGGELLSVGCEGEGVPLGGDCADLDENIHPGIERDDCDDRDNDCDAQVDEDGALYWPDEDHDGYGDNTAGRDQLCEGVNRPYDCDDSDGTLKPSAQDCDKRCSDLGDECAARDATVLFAIEAHQVWPSVDGVFVSDSYQGPNGLTGWFEDPVGDLDLTDADFLLDPNTASVGTVSSASDLLHDDGVTDLMVGLSGNLWFVVEGPLQDRTFTYGVDHVDHHLLGGYGAFVLDMNADGSDDVVISGWDSQLVVSLGGGSSLSQEGDVLVRSPDGDDTFSRQVLVHGDQVALDDTSGDEAVYLIDPVTESFVVNEDTWVARVRPDELLPQVELLSSGDLDGDGQLDLLVKVSDGQFSQAQVVWGPVLGDVELGDTVFHYGYDHILVPDQDGDGADELAWCDPGQITVNVVQGRAFEGATQLGNGWQVLGAEEDKQVYTPLVFPGGLLTHGNDLESGERRVWGWSF